MNPDQWFEVTKSLGIASPLVIVLIYLLRMLVTLLTKSGEERAAITAQFVAAMQTLATTSAVAQQQAAASLHELAGAMRDASTRSLEEHNRITDAIGKIGKGAS